MSSKGIGGHHSASSATDEWLTPPDLLKQLGDFDLDPCAPIVRPWPMAEEHYTIADNGLLKRWPKGARAFVNAPYSEPLLSQFLARLCEHQVGTSLVFARTETAWFFRYGWRAAHAALFLEGRLHFHYVDGTRAKHNAGGPSVLFAYGNRDARKLAELDHLGQFQPLLMPRSVAVLAIPTGESWRKLLEAVMAGRGPIRLDDLYRLIERHRPGRKHWREKVRQTLQRGPFERVSRGEWVLA